MGQIHHVNVSYNWYFVPLLFCPCVCWMPCLVLNPPFHNSKIPLLKIGYITGNYLFWQEKIQAITLTIKICYHLVDSPFKYYVHFLNCSLNYTPPPDHNLDNLFLFLYSFQSCKLVHLWNQIIHPHWWQWIQRLWLYPWHCKCFWQHCYEQLSLQLLYWTFVFHLPKPCFA